MDKLNFTIEDVSFSISEFLTQELAEKIAFAQWNHAEWADSIISWCQYHKTQTDCFNIVAENKCGDVVGRIFCLLNDSDSTRWYYGDLFVIPEYRRQHIAENMLLLAEQTLCGKKCTTLCCYVEPENTPSLNLQRKCGFMEKPYQPFNNLLNDGQLMFEKELSPCFEQNENNTGGIYGDKI